MSGYMARAFQRSNSSFLLSCGNVFKAQVLPLRTEKYLVDVGIGTPRICMKDELTGVPTNTDTRFENRVGFMGRAPTETLIKKRFLERYFIDLVAGKSLVKEQTLARCNSLVRSSDAVMSDEPLLLLPRRFRQEQARIELNRIWESNRKVKGFILNKIRGGFAVGIAGFIAFYPFRCRKRRGKDKRQWQRRRGRSEDYRFLIQSIKSNPQKTEIVVI